MVRTQREVNEYSKKKYKQRRKEYYNKKKKEDPDFFNRKMTAWRKEKIKKDPTWGARRQKEFRVKHPDKFNYMMARFYLRRMTQEKIKELINEIENERSQNGQK